MNVNWPSNGCRRWRRDIALLASGGLPEGEREQVEAHLADCARCRHDRDQLGRLTVSLRSIGQPSPDLEPSAALRARWTRAVRAEPQTESLPRIAARALALTRVLVQRPAWAGLAAVWLAIVFFQVTSPTVAELPSAGSVPAPRQLYLALRDPDWPRQPDERESASREADEPKASSRKPRSERQSGTNAA